MRMHMAFFLVIKCSALHIYGLKRWTKEWEKKTEFLKNPSRQGQRDDREGD